MLRPFKRTDHREWQSVRSRNHSWLSKWDATSPPGSGRSVTFAQMVRSMNRAGQAGEALSFVMCWDRAWPKRSRFARLPIIGQVTISNIFWGSARMGQIGYWIDQDHAGRGLMPTAVALLSDYCFQVVGIHRIEINIRPENKPSLRVVEKLGYRFEGERARFLHINGQWCDHLSFALTAEETQGGLLNNLLSGTGVPREISK